MGTGDQSIYVIAKEILIAMIEKEYLDRTKDKAFAQTVGEMYNTILKTISNPSE